MPSLWLPIALIALAGAAVAAQPAFNGQLAAHLGSPLRAALVNFLAGASVLGVLVLVLLPRHGLPDARNLAQVPTHLWLVGGSLGALFVATAAWAAPKVGAAAFFATLVAAQLIAALVMDHFGLLGMEERPATMVRVLGAALLVLGALLVVRR
ncbi:DMT family transporter [Algiphilus sp.]|uniref:DMT family transporter n=1 Tax=Algiphilus sp. TaxID=1872431 RepID=UPI003BA9CFE2